MKRFRHDDTRTPTQDADGCEKIGETIAMVEILALGHRQIEAGQVQPAADVVSRLRERSS